jgi:hypothetical protein
MLGKRGRLEARLSSQYLADAFTSSRSVVLPLDDPPEIVLWHRIEALAPVLPEPEHRQQSRLARPLHQIRRVTSSREPRAGSRPLPRPPA